MCFYLLFCFLSLNIVCRSVRVLGFLQIHNYRHLKFDTFVYFFSSIIYVKLGINDWYNVVSFLSIMVLEYVFVVFAAWKTIYKENQTCFGMEWNLCGENNDIFYFWFRNILCTGLVRLRAIKWSNGGLGSQVTRFRKWNYSSKVK